MTSTSNQLSKFSFQSRLNDNNCLGLSDSCKLFNIRRSVKTPLTNNDLNGIVEDLTGSPPRIDTFKYFKAGNRIRSNPAKEVVSHLSATYDFTVQKNMNGNAAQAIENPESYQLKKNSNTIDSNYWDFFMEDDDFFWESENSERSDPNSQEICEKGENESSPTSSLSKYKRKQTNGNIGSPPKGQCYYKHDNKDQDQNKTTMSSHNILPEFIQVIPVAAFSISCFKQLLA